MTNVFNGMFGKIAPGMCRLSMSGGIAVKTTTGYKSYNVKNGRLTNCDSFVFDIGEEFFFVIPTNKVEVGDIILVSGKPKCVVKSDKEDIGSIDYNVSLAVTHINEFENKELLNLTELNVKYLSYEETRKLFEKST